MKSLLGLGFLMLGGALAAQACGSSDGSKKPRGERPEGGAAGADSGAGDGGADNIPTGGTAGATGAGGRAPTAGASGGEAMGGSGGAAGEGGVAGEGGAVGEVSGGGQGGVGEGGGTADGGTGGAGEQVTCEVAPTCSQSLNDIGTGDFSISFTITTSAQVGSGIVAQRGVCMHSKFWDIRLRAGGTGMSIETDDQVHYTSLIVPTNVSDGVPHEVRICRKAGVIYGFTDGTLDVQGASLASFATLPAFASKTSVCGGFGTITLDGTLADVCVGAL